MAEVPSLISLGATSATLTETTASATTITTTAMSTTEEILEIGPSSNQVTCLATGSDIQHNDNDQVEETCCETSYEDRSKELCQSDSLAEEKSSEINHEEDQSQRLDEGEPRVWIKIQRQLDGFDPDTAEFERLRMPPASVVDHEMSETYTRRQIVVQNLSMSELSDPRVMNVMSQSREFHVWYVRCGENTEDPSGEFLVPAEQMTKGVSTTADILGEQQQQDQLSRSLWKGCVVASLRSVAQAEEAVVYLQGIRRDIDVKTLNGHDNAESILNTWRLRQSSHVIPHGGSSDELLVVNNLDSSTTEDDLREMFPLADDIVIPRDKERRRARGAGASVKGYAYLSFGDQQKLKKTYDSFGRRAEADMKPSTDRLKLMKYRLPVDIPQEFLRLRRRFRILTIIRQLNSCDTEDSKVLDTQRRQLVENINFWMDRVEEDDVIRKKFGLPAYKLDELHELLDIAKPLVCDMNNSVSHMLKMSNRERSMLEELMIKIGRTKQCGMVSRNYRKFDQSSSNPRKSGYYSNEKSSNRPSDLLTARKRIEKYIHLTNVDVKHYKDPSDNSERKETENSAAAVDFDQDKTRYRSNSGRTNYASSSRNSAKRTNCVTISDRSLRTSNTTLETDKRAKDEDVDVIQDDKEKIANSTEAGLQTSSTEGSRVSKRSAASCSSSTSLSSTLTKESDIKTAKRHCTEDSQRKSNDSRASSPVDNTVNSYKGIDITVGATQSDDHFMETIQSPDASNDEADIREGH